MVKRKPLLFSLVIMLFLLPISFAFAQEDFTMDYEVTTYEDDIDYELFDEEFADTIEDMYENAPDDMLVSPTPEEISKEGVFAILAGMGILMIFPLLISLATYIFSSLALAKIGNDLGYKNSWFAWIPLLSTIMLMQLGEKSAWWILVPFVGQIMMIIAIMRITERRGYDKLLGLIVLTGIGAYVLLYLLAWSPKDATTPIQATTQTPVQPTTPTQM